MASNHPSQKGGAETVNVNMSFRYLGLLLLFSQAVLADERPKAGRSPMAVEVDLSTIETPPGKMATIISRFTADTGSIERSAPPRESAEYYQLKSKTYSSWRDAIRSLDFDNMSVSDRIDYLLLNNRIDHELRQLDIDKKRSDENAAYVPFASLIFDLEAGQRKIERPNGRIVADTLTRLVSQIEEAKGRLSATDPTGDGKKLNRSTANRAAQLVGDLRETLLNYHKEYQGYDPAYAWWVDEPMRKAAVALEEYAKLIRERLVGIRPNDNTTIIGDPIGRQALLADLDSALIPYSPEELIAIANEEFAWCRKEMLRASHELGFGDDWHKALEKVKTQHVEPGEQQGMIRDLAYEAIDFLEANNLVTLPPLAKNSWRMEMMTADRQLVNPFFTGGEVISVSFPTSGMTHEQKLMSMRGNNRHFSKATVHHELIPGHHLQMFMNDRYRAYRKPFRTPFWTEGWALYWEMVLWDKGFPKSAEDRVGFLFWRMHRCARIIFSLKFHLGEMTPQQCIDFLVTEVGHERENATAEVRRSFNGDYGPLYQCAYMLGAMQLRSLRKEMVDAHKMSERSFHDAILRENAIPIELLRAILTDQKLPRGFKTSWRFAGDPLKSK
jgi:hypothetical protein